MQTLWRKLSGSLLVVLAGRHPHTVDHSLAGHAVKVLHLTLSSSGWCYPWVAVHIVGHPLCMPTTSETWLGVMSCRGANSKTTPTMYMKQRHKRLHYSRGYLLTASFR